jgi:hypothetical protein
MFSLLQKHTDSDYRIPMIPDDHTVNNYMSLRDSDSRVYISVEWFF